MCNGFIFCFMMISTAQLILSPVKRPETYRIPADLEQRPACAFIAL